MSHLIFGVIIIIAGLFGVFAWWDDFGMILRGLMPISLVVVGLVAIGASLTPKSISRPEDGAL